MRRSLNILVRLTDLFYNRIRHQCPMWPELKGYLSDIRHFGFKEFMGDNLSKFDYACGLERVWVLMKSVF